MSDENIQVVCRVRPPADGDNSPCISIDHTNNIVVLTQSKKQFSFTFDFVADQNASQADVFENVGLQIAESCIQGYNGTIMCYGQTG